MIGYGHGLIGQNKVQQSLLNYRSGMQKYQLQEQIGHGAYSIVFKALNVVTNRIVAIKRINHTNPDISVVLNRQIHTLKKLNHPNIIKLYQVYADSVYAYLVFDYLPFDLIGYYKEMRRIHNCGLPHRDICYIVWQMCQALAYMHHSGLMHRDIKPENVLIDPATLSIKLIDFGFAIQLNPYVPLTQYMITRWYRPLEIVLGLPYDTKADVFALGALVMELYQGEEIFRSASNLDQLYWVLDICGYPSIWPQAIIRMTQLGVHFDPKKQPQIYKMVKKLRPQTANLVISMLQTSPFSRISMAEILCHPYFAPFQEMTHSKALKNNVQTGLTASTENIKTLNRNRTNSALSNQKLPLHRVNPLQQQQQQQNPYLSPSNSYTNLQLNLAMLSSNKKQYNLPQLSTQRTKTQNTVQINNGPLSQRRMSSDEKHFFQAHRNRVETQRNGGLQKQFKFVSDHNDTQNARHKTQGYEQARSNRKGISNSINNWQPPRPSNKFINMQQQQKGLKNRTKSYQGINVMSLKRNHSSNTIVTKNTDPLAHVLNYQVITGIQRKEPTFSKIRDKLVHQSKPTGKIKISLTDRHQFYNERRLGSHI